MPCGPRLGLTSACRGQSSARAADVPVYVVSAERLDPLALIKAIAEAVAQLDGINLLVNNAGATKPADFFTLNEEDLHGEFWLKFHGHVR